MLFVLFDDRDDVLFLFKHVKKKRSQGVMQPTDRNWRILGHRLLQKKKKKEKFFTVWNSTLLQAKYFWFVIQA